MKLFVLFYSLLTALIVNSQEQTNVSSQVENDKTQFLRIQYNENNAPQYLQLANVRYAPANNYPSNVYVDLISAVHVGDKSYYESLNSLFKNYDAVLYELVAPEGTKVSDKSAGEGKSMLSALQHGMKNVLGLTFQLDEVDYDAENFVHADISPDDFVKSMDEKGESFLSMFLRMWLVGMQQQATNPNAINDMDLIFAMFSNNREAKLKQLVAVQFIEMDPVMNALEGKEGSTILTTRNLKALKVLREQLDKGHKKLAIFYGAAHMPEMEELLITDFNFKPVKTDWVNAWDLTE
ncbi:MAG TPA: hypothetical protein PK055_05680 [Gammaproteobacteria bacterium]|jgi:hypothetical protein|nr:hypothetical protein [Xanthomonadales bacterium]HPI96242.1 hypothetical protein [Gammaproteobacteria bacterium]HPQ87126.1 hypothetical protein [Gammaproteobacteria bacterium]